MKENFRLKGFFYVQHSWGQLASSSTILVVVSLSLLGSGISHGAPVGGDPDAENMLSFIAAQQRHTGEIYDSLSYRAAITSTVIETFSEAPFSQTVIYHYSKRGSSLLVTREASNGVKELEQRKNGKKIDSLFTVFERPFVKRILVTDEYLVWWNDVATPALDVFYKSDWPNGEGEHNKNLNALTKQVELRSHCFGLLTPLYQLLDRPKPFISWEVDRQDDDNLVFERTLTTDPKMPIRDLRLVVGPEFGLVTSGSFNPPDGSEAFCNLSYTTTSFKGGTVVVPEEFEFRMTDDKGVVQDDIQIVFFKYRDESTQDPYTFGDIGVPEGAHVNRRVSPNKIESLVWKGGVLQDTESDETSPFPTEQTYSTQGEWK